MEELNNIDLTKEQLKIVKGLLQQYIPQAQVWAYGSRVKWTSTTKSDLDIVAFIEENHKKNISMLRDAFEESSLPFRVDLFVWNEVPEQFHRNIKEHYFTLQLPTSSPIIPNGWKEVKLGELIDIKHGFAFKGEFLSDIDNGNIVLTPGNFQIGGGFKINFNKIKFYASDNFPKEYILKEGDLLVSMTDLSKLGDTLGSPIITPAIKGYRFLHNQRLGLIQSISNEINSFFIYWLMRTNEYQKTIVSGSTGSTVKHTAPIRIKDYKFLLPPLSEQKAIASVLGALDDKIELNKRINANLEAQAQAIFKSWFVDFEPWGGVMPDDWREGKLGDFLQSIKKPIKASKYHELPYVPIDMIPMHSISFADFRPSEEAQSSLLAFKKNDILIGAMRVYFHRVSIAPFDGITRTTCFVLRPIKESYLEYSLLLCNQNNTIDYAQNTSKGSTMPYAVWDNGLANMPIKIPQLKIIQEFSEILKPIIARLRDGLLENRTLSSLRDTLLPKLMSGEIRINYEGKPQLIK